MVLRYLAFLREHGQIASNGFLRGTQRPSQLFNRDPLTLPQQLKNVLSSFTGTHFYSYVTWGRTQMKR
ncbi:hypothetical protein D3C76_1079820 [compost metagenome]